jgi:soluble lytic murein transglycosylase
MNPSLPERCAKFSAMRRSLFSVLTRPRWRAGLRPFCAPGLLMLAAALLAAPALHAAPGDDTVLQARDALRKRDRTALANARYASVQQQHPLAMWVDYWELGNRLAEVQQADLDAFYARWPGTYVEDRLRNDWLLELGKRRDWVNLRTEFPRFRMNDDREVSCYALLARHLAGEDVRQPARAAWFAQRELDDGCKLMASTLFEAKVLNADDAWHELRLAIENNRPLAARAAAALLGPAVDKAVMQLLENPARYLTGPHGRNPGAGSHGHELLVLALMRAAASDPDYAVASVQAADTHRLHAAQEATVWAHIAKQAALKLQPNAAEHARHAWKLWDRSHPPGTQPPWSDDLLAWHVRAALRQPAREANRWALMQRAIEAMPVAEQRQDSWVYWQARATLARAPAGPEGDAARSSARNALAGMATPLSFYGQLAGEEIGEAWRLPATAAALAEAERLAVRKQPGLVRALQLMELGLRSEGVREWNYTLRGMADRELLAAADWACERKVWDRCINTSERTRSEIDLAQRYPLVHRELITERARAAGLDPAVVFGLIRQESRFVTDARSGVGASGLMQLMPATASWTAKKIGLPWHGGLINDNGTNLQLGTAYLRRVLDDFGGSLAMAAAAYNAGPGRPRRWREGGVVMEPAAWAESIPFNETRDYVKKVLANSVTYSALLGAPGAPHTPLRIRLGAPIGPREPATVAPDRDLP